MSAGPLRSQLENCADGPFTRTEFSIAHRGAPLGYPEHTREGYVAAAQQGAGIIECDVTFTQDLALVCRHSQCDLHSTTNILQTDLAKQCRQEFKPATANSPASAQCCTSEITLAQFRTLCARHDHVDSTATTVDAYLQSPITPVEVENVGCGTLLTHAESIEVIGQLGSNFTPELKAPMVEMPFNNTFSQQDYASKMLEEYVVADISPSKVHPQSFNLNDVLYWIEHYPQFAQQAVYLDPRGRVPSFVANLKDMQALKASGVNTIAPPMPMLLSLDNQGNLQPSEYATMAKAAGLDIITWTFESGSATSPNNWMYTKLHSIMHREGDMYGVLDVLAKQIGIKGIFSDWPGTVTYYANCFDL